MRGQSKDQRDLARDHERAVRPGEERIQRRGTVERLRQGQEVDGQKKREHKSRKPVDEKGPVSGMAPVAPIACAHRVTARMAIAPRTASATPKSTKTTSAARPRQPSHSPAMVRTPSGAWMATASTNTP